MKEISDSLIHTVPRSVSLVHHNFRNDVNRHSTTFSSRSEASKAERTGAGTSLVSSLMRYLQLGVANLQ
jgi:hypothetical protein